MKGTNKKFILKGKHKDMIFYVLMLVIPVTQFVIFYIGVNFNSILLSFQKIDILNNTTTWTTANIKNALKDLTSNIDMLLMARTSLLSYVLILCIGTPLGLLFSYYIYKKMPGSGAFRVILFLPSIISSIVMVTMFRFFVEMAIPEYVNTFFGKTIMGLFENPKSTYPTIIFYNIWVGFGTSVLMYSNGMSSISPEIIESAHLDGAKGFREFWYIVLPMVYPTLTTFLVTGVAGIFNNQINLYSMFGEGAAVEVRTYGYYLYLKTQTAVSRSEYPPLSAIGLIMTVVVVPVTLLVRHVLEKYGPKED